MVVRFEDFELDLRSRELRRGSSLVILQHQPFEILCAMLERTGGVVTREELCRRLWPEGTHVDFNHSLNAAIKRLRASLGDTAERPRFVETLPRRGYRFVGTVLPDEPAAPKAGTGFVRLAVLPFRSLGGEDDFSDGLTEQLIANLGERACCVRIISRMSSMVFRGGELRAREIGESLQASYLVEGSVHRYGDRLRIIVWLVEAEDETEVWRDTIDCRVTDPLSVQADVAARIVPALSAHFRAAICREPQ